IVGALCHVWKVAVWDQPIISLWIATSCLLEHRLGNVDAQDAKTEVAQEAGRPPRPTAEVQGSRAPDSFADGRGEVTEGEIVGPGKVERGISSRTGVVVIDVQEVWTHRHSHAQRATLAAPRGPDRCRVLFDGSSRQSAREVAFPSHSRQRPLHLQPDPFARHSMTV